MLVIEGLALALAPSRIEEALCLSREPARRPAARAWADRWLRCGHGRSVAGAHCAVKGFTLVLPVRPRWAFILLPGSLGIRATGMLAPPLRRGSPIRWSARRQLPCTSGPYACNAARCTPRLTAAVLALSLALATDERRRTAPRGARELCRPGAERQPRGRQHHHLDDGCGAAQSATRCCPTAAPFEDLFRDFGFPNGPNGGPTDRHRADRTRWVRAS